MTIILILLLILLLYIFFFKKSITFLYTFISLFLLCILNKDIFYNKRLQ